MEKNLREVMFEVSPPCLANSRTSRQVHTLALTDDGYVYSFGGGSYGQLGVKDTRENGMYVIRGDVDVELCCDSVLICPRLP
jgi:alpha-tubulin suppressor-like RCC1 family protein